VRHGAISRPEIAVPNTIGELDQEGSANVNVRAGYNPGLTEKAGEGSGLVVACVF
jgi:hypothetical protein